MRMGATHYSIDDMGLMRMIPGVVILNPQDPADIRSSVRAMMKHQGPVYMRIGNAPVACLFEEGDVELGKGRKIQDGGDVTIISTGPTTAAVMEALPALEKAGIHADVIGLATVYPLDEEMIVASAKKTGKVVTVEEHFVYGGIGTMISDLLAAKQPTEVLKLGIPNEYALTGPYNEILAHYGLDADGIAKSVLAFMK